MKPSQLPTSWDVDFGYVVVGHSGFIFTMAKEGMTLTFNVDADSQAIKEALRELKRECSRADTPFTSEDTAKLSFLLHEAIAHKERRKGKRRKRGK